MAKRPNYGQERAERQRKKAARRDERLAAKAGRRQDGASSAEGADGTRPLTAEPATATSKPLPPADSIAMGRLAHALRFVCGAEHPVTLAAQQAARSGNHEDIGRARVLFLQLTSRDQHAALTIAGATPGGR